VDRSEYGYQNYGYNSGGEFLVSSVIFSRKFKFRVLCRLRGVCQGMSEESVDWNKTM